MKSCTIAVVQFSIAHLRPEDNLRRMEEFVCEAKRRGAEVIIFPEDALTGSIFGDRTWLEKDGRFLGAFCEMAKRYGIDIVPGSWMEERGTGAYSTSYYIDASGMVLGRYDKNHLYHSERSFLTPGTEALVVDTRFGRAGIIICWDLLFAEQFERMKEKGVEIVYCPSYWYKEIAGQSLSSNFFAEEEQVNAFCRARAVEYNIVFVYANAAQEIGYADGAKDTLIGQSQITLPVVGPVVRAFQNQEALLIQTVSFDMLEETKQLYGRRADCSND